MTIRGRRCTQIIRIILCIGEKNLHAPCPLLSRNFAGAKAGPSPRDGMLYALCSMPYALCPMPHAPCPMLHALCPMLLPHPVLKLGHLFATDKCFFIDDGLEI